MLLRQSTGKFDDEDDDEDIDEEKNDYEDTRTFGESKINYGLTDDELQQYALSVGKTNQGALPILRDRLKTRIRTYNKGKSANEQITIDNMPIDIQRRMATEILQNKLSGAK